MSAAALALYVLLFVIFVVVFFSSLAHLSRSRQEIYEERARYHMADMKSCKPFPLTKVLAALLSVSLVAWLAIVSYLAQVK